MNVYEIPFGNGFNGSKMNIGRRIVVADNIAMAKKIMSEKENIKIGNMGRAVLIPALIQDK